MEKTGFNQLRKHTSGAGLLALIKRENMTCKKDQIDGKKIVEILCGSGLRLQVLLQKTPT